MIDVDGVQMHDSLKPQLVPIGQVQEHPDNPRRGEVDKIAESVTANGVYKPIIVQKSTGFILSGNHTYRAISQAGASQVPVIYLDVDEARAKAILLADNRTSELGGYDESQLIDLLTELSEGATLTGTGYTEGDLSDLLVSMEPKAAAKQHDADQLDEYNSDGLDITVGFAEGQRKVAGRRMVVLDLPVNRYLWLIDHLARIGADMDIESNADVMLWLVAQYAGSEVPPLPAEDEVAA